MRTLCARPVVSALTEALPPREVGPLYVTAWPADGTAPRTRAARTMHRNGRRMSRTYSALVDRAPVDSFGAMAFLPRRVYVALVTPFGEDDAVDHGVLEKLAADALDAGAAGIVALATTGEPTALDAGERDAVVATIASVCADKGGELIVGAGTNDTRETIRRHEALADVAGVTAALAV